MGVLFGLKDQRGIPIKKPWRILSNCKDIAMIEKKCPGHPVHKSLAPGNAKLARETLRRAHECGQHCGCP